MKVYVNVMYVRNNSRMMMMIMRREGSEDTLILRSKDMNKI